MLKIGLTGGIGSGKTTVTKKFLSLNVPVIDADEISRKLAQPGQSAYPEIVNAFGEQVLDRSGEINRAYLRNLIFSDARARVKLEGILHPLIRSKIAEEIESLDCPYCIVAIPLLIETGQTDLVDRILVLNIPREIQVRRTMARDNASAEAIEAIINSQVDNQTRLSLADDVLDNSSDVDNLYKQIEALHEKYKVLANSAEQAIDLADNNNNDTQTINKTNNTDMLQQQKCTPGLLKSNAAYTPSAEEVIYELPLNEKFRTLVRLDALFKEIAHHLAGESYWDSRAAMNAFVAVMNIFSRPEIKTELLKELDRINAVVAKCVATGIEPTVMEEIQNELNAVARNLRSVEGQLGQSLKQNEFVMSIRQRDSIPGGALEMDVPAYGHWLNKNIESRCQDIRDWLGCYSPAQKALELILRLIRNNGEVYDVATKAGMYQHSLDVGVCNQLVRVVIPKNAYYFPEISGGRQRFTVRFLKSNGVDRPVQIEQDMPFKLICCAL